MKLIHLSDLHLGKRINAFSMIEDQRDILTKIIGIIDNERPDAVLIAGDVYDKSVPSADAVELFDDFLVRLAKRNLQIFVIIKEECCTKKEGQIWRRKKLNSTSKS